MLKCLVDTNFAPLPTASDPLLLSWFHFVPVLECRAQCVSNHCRVGELYHSHGEAAVVLR